MRCGVCCVLGVEGNGGAMGLARRCGKMLLSRGRKETVCPFVALSALRCSWR